MKALLRLVALLLLSALALQLYFLTRVALMWGLDPHSTTFQRSEIVRMLGERHQVVWTQQWVSYDRISPQLKRAVIAAEDAGFVEHSGVEWDAIERAWEKNQNAQAQAQRVARVPRHGKPAREPKLVGGSTITQQLAKNLFLAGERSLPRKAQEFVVTFMLEAMLPKRRILEIYLNNVEWGEGVFGAQAAARHYFQVDAASLAPVPAARLAVMLPAPKRFEKQPASSYVLNRAATVAARMGSVELP